jgi:hypothetical protein
MRKNIVGARSNLVKTVILAFTGSVLPLMGLFLLWYPNYMIRSLQESISQNLSNNPQGTALQGSLDWWTAWGKITYEPVAYVILVSGIVVLVFALVYYLVSNKKEVQRASN